MAAGRSLLPVDCTVADGRLEDEEAGRFFLPGIAFADDGAGWAVKEGDWDGTLSCWPASTSKSDGREAGGFAMAAGILGGEGEGVRAPPNCAPCGCAPPF